MQIQRWSKNTKVRECVFLLIMKKIDWDPVTKLHLQWEISNSCLNFEWCCTSLLPCLAPLQSNSGKTWRREYQCFNLNHDKGKLAIFCRTSKNTAIEKNWTEAQSGFNLKEVHCKKHKTGKLPKNFVLVFYRRLETILKKSYFLRK